MTPGDRMKKIIQAAKDLLISDDERKIQQKYLEVLLPLVDILAKKIVCSMVMNSRQFRKEQGEGLLPDEVYLDFLENKAVTRNFVERLVSAENPLGFLYRTIHNLVVDHLSKLGPSIVDRHGRDAGQEPDPVENMAAPETFDMQAQLERAELSLELKQLFESLPDKDRFLIMVVHVDKLYPPAVQLVRALSEKRGVDPERVMQDLDARAERYWNKSADLGKLVEMRSNRVSTAWEMIARIEAEISSRHGELETQPESAPGLDDEQLKKLMPVTRAGLEKLGIGDLNALLRIIYGKLQRRIELLEEAKKGLQSGMPGGYAWDEVASILGELKPGMDEREKERIVNTLTKRSIRLSKKLNEMRKSG
ncbi:MAG: sigma-70 family RNA polymerase sigma factor [Deltaproteobacteria bacterium]|nr:sigma-70 family RNA polymerase sigma factor [Deltaproteobacteria bacterium]